MGEKGLPSHRAEDLVGCRLNSRQPN